MGRKSDIITRTILGAGDLLAMYGSLFLALYVRNQTLIAQFKDFWIYFFFLYLFWLFILAVLDLYNPIFLKKPYDFFFSLTIFSIIAFCSAVIYFYFIHLPDIAPKVILLLHIIFFDLIFVFWRYAANMFLESSGVKERIAIVGYRNSLQEIAKEMQKLYSVSVVFCPQSATNQSVCGALFAGVDMVSDIAAFKEAVRHQKVTSVVLALPPGAERSVIQDMFSHLPLNLNYIDVNELYESVEKKVSLEDLDEVWFLEKVSKAENRFFEISKRLFDIFFGLMGVALFAILFPCIALAISLDSAGGILFTQPRMGKDKKVFVLHKFRTMTTTPHQSETLWREKNKDNITRVGRVLRRTHLDELPQCLSILKGDMSFIGPRPEWVEMAKVFEEQIPFYAQRSVIKPGIIGWAQINFSPSQSVAQAAEKFKYDLYYIKNRSWILDLEIVLKTIKLFLW